MSKQLGAIAVALALVVVGLVFGARVVAHDNTPEACKGYCPAKVGDTLSATLGEFKAPALTAPQPPKPTPRPSGGKVVTYDVMTRGAITTDVATFKAQALETYNDAKGWSRLGVSFQEVASGGQFTLVLSEAAQVPSFSSGCDSTYSCAVGRYVIINQDRWVGATSPWNSAGGSLRNYRHMVINHETGHWLGHGHKSCPGAGQAAPVMQQQSIDLQGCSFNPWPVESELWSTRLGI